MVYLFIFIRLVNNGIVINLGVGDKGYFFFIVDFECFI